MYRSLQSQPDQALVVTSERSDASPVSGWMGNPGMDKSGERRAATVDRLRADIDAGRTRDKVAASDPAAAPLGADEEAAGTPLGADAIALARRQELKPAEAKPTRAVVPIVAAVTLLVTMAALVLLVIRSAL
jgi:hypothetical protein